MKTPIQPLLLISLLAVASYTYAEELKVKRMQALPQLAAPVAQVQPITTPAIPPASELDTKTLNPQPFPPVETTKIVPQSIGVKASQSIAPVKAITASPSAMQPVATQLPAVKQTPAMQPVGGLPTLKPINSVAPLPTVSGGALGEMRSPMQEVRVNNQQWDELKNLPDNTMLILPEGKKMTVGEARKVQQQDQKKLDAMKSAPTATGRGNVVKATSKTLDVKAILQAETAAASAAATAPSKFANGVSSKVNVDLKAMGAALCSPAPCIATVNGKADVGRVVFTPGTADTASKVTIRGAGFGENASVGAYLTGSFNKRPVLRVDTVRDDQITAYFESGFTGEIDREGVGLTITLPNGKQLTTASSAKFYAKREEQTIHFDQIPKSNISADKPYTGMLDYKNGGITYYEFRSNAGDGSNQSIERTFNDIIRFDFLKSGFQVTDATANIQNVYPSSGCDGDYAFGESGIDMDPKFITIRKKMTLCYSKIFLSPPARAYNSKFTDMKLTVTGPAGVSPIK
ncbi:MAG: hypothetical protein HOP21_04190 [Methylotenera sp.]|nr:hypothetical protein [Methylotenera sp.]